MKNGKNDIKNLFLYKKLTNKQINKDRKNKHKSAIIMVVVKKALDY